MVKLRLVLPFSGMLVAPKALLIVGGPTTVRLAFEVLPVPPSVEVTCTELFFTPTLFPVTFTDTVQAALDAIVPPVSDTEPLPAVAVAVPPQVLLRLLGVATTKPAGKVSVNAIPLNPRAVLGLLMVKLRLVVPFSGIDAAPKALVMLAGEATVKLADAVLPWPPLTEVTWAVVLVYCPDAAPVTVTLNMHGVLTATVALERLISPPEPLAWLVWSVPPHTVDVPGVTVRPAGSVSWNATWFSETVLPVGLVIVNCNDVVAFKAMVEGLNAFAIEGGATTLIVTDVVRPFPPSMDVTALLMLV